MAACLNEVWVCVPGSVRKFAARPNCEVHSSSNPSLNRSSGKMTPADYTIETLVSGICSFALLSIDKIGNGYELLFTLKEVSCVSVSLAMPILPLPNTHSLNSLNTPPLLTLQYTASTNSYTSTGITLSSAAFDVSLGPPYELVRQIVLLVTVSTVAPSLP